jgi:predicted nucleic acid-binding protein
MNAVFADTSFYVAVANPRDEFHHEALHFVREYRGRIITTEQVLTEAGNWFSRTGDRVVFLNLVESIRNDAKTTVVWSERSLFEAGLGLFAARSDKEWSLTDCISFAVMKHHGVTEALTADRHFEQAGFKVLLK